MFFTPRWAVAALVVLVAGITAVITFRQQDLTVAQVGGAASVTSTRTPVQPAPDAASAVEPVSMVHRPIRTATRTLTASGFETLVPNDQLHALDRLLAGMREGRATVPQAVSTEELNDRGERVLRVLVIEPVTIELLPGTPAEPNKSPGKDPNK